MLRKLTKGIITVTVLTIKKVLTLNNSITNEPGFKTPDTISKSTNTIIYYSSW